MDEEKFKESYQNLIKQLNEVIERQNKRIDELEERVKNIESETLPYWKHI